MKTKIIEGPIAKSGRLQKTTYESVQSEIAAAEDAIERAQVHLENAKKWHRSGKYNEARAAMKMAQHRMEDWERSDKAILAAKERRLQQERRGRQRGKLVVLEGVKMK